MSADATAPAPDPVATPGPLADPAARRREQRGWYFYDWANSAYVTTVATVLFTPYLARVAERAACGAPGTPENPCTTNLHLLGIPVSPGSLPLYIVTASTLLSAVLLPIVGTFADRAASKRRHLLGYAMVGAAAAAAMFFVAGVDWQLGVVLLFVANIALAASLVVYDAILVDIAGPDERDHVSSRGWALGYLGGGLLLALNLVLVLGGSNLGVDGETAVRICLLSAGLWWGCFTVIPYLRLRDRPPISPEAGRGGIGHGFTQLAHTLRDLTNYPQTLLFLVAYLFFNDGVQTVIAAASTYGDRQLGLGQSTLIATILMVQFVAFGGALLFGRLARRYGSRAVIQYSLLVWAAVVIAAYWLPVGAAGWFMALAVLIGIVLGGTQALSRSFYSLLIPRGREAEYFSLYQACERGTSWLGTLVFGVVHQLTDSYRPAIVALVAFFLVGFFLLRRVDAPRAIAEAGNTAPAVL